MSDPNVSLEALLRELREACDFLQSFTLGHRGFTREDGAAGIRRVRTLCEHLQVQFSVGPHAAMAERAVATGLEHINEAKARLDLMQERLG
jgi:hypothetical protein